MRSDVLIVILVFFIPLQFIFSRFKLYDTDNFKMKSLLILEKIKYLVKETFSLSNNDKISNELISICKYKFGIDNDIIRDNLILPSNQTYLVGNIVQIINKNIISVVSGISISEDKIYVLVENDTGLEEVGYTTKHIEHSTNYKFSGFNPLIFEYFSHFDLVNKLMVPRLWMKNTK